VLCQPQPLVDQLTQPDPLRQYRGREQPGVRDQISVKLTETRDKS
jgi:hypothetical protein